MQESCLPDARIFGLGLSVFGKCTVADDLGKGGGVLGGIFMGQISIPVWLQGWLIFQRSRLDYSVALQTIKREFQSDEHEGDPLELWAWRAQCALQRGET